MGRWQVSAGGSRRLNNGGQSGYWRLEKAVGGWDELSPPKGHKGGGFTPFPPPPHEAHAPVLGHRPCGDASRGMQRRGGTEQQTASRARARTRRAHRSSQ